MKNRFLISLCSLLFIFSIDLAGQVECITDPPLPPVLRSVSIDPESGNTILKWALSPSSGIAAYIIYSYNNGDGTPLDTVRDPAATSFTVGGTASKYLSVSYVVSAMRLPRCTSIFSNIINSIFEVATIDTCLKKIEIGWNKYPSIPEVVTGYSVLMSLNEGAFAEEAILSNDVTNFTIENFEIDADYCFVVRANLINGEISNSNKVCIRTKMQRPPDWINADQATINSSGQIELSFTVDPLSEISKFRLERRQKTTEFAKVADLTSVNGSVHFTDEDAKKDSVNYYRLSAISNCNLPVTVSNLASNMVLSLDQAGNDLLLSWNQYRSWLGDVSDYKIFINTGDGYSEKASISRSDTTFVQPYDQIMYQVSGKDLCFYVTATEKANPHNIGGTSTSSEICTSPLEKITVPNVFTPDNDLRNDLFKPVLSFTPSNYHLLVSDRNGRVFFETRDYLEAWDGTNKGEKLPVDVYLWYLRLTTPSGKVINKTGTITIVESRQ